MKAVLFDLDGTLLPMDQKMFIKKYYDSICSYLKKYNYSEQIIIEGINYGVYKMIENNGIKLNKDVFWEEFSNKTCINKKVIEPLFNEYYELYFDNVRGTTKNSFCMIEAIKELKAKNYRLILATNPVFPRIATYQRINWAKLNYEDFDLITTYENSSFSKPNIKYYQEILGKMNLKASDCLIVGNDTTEDMTATEIGLKEYLIINDLIDKNNVKDNYRRGTRKDFLCFVKKMEKAIF